MSGFQAPCQQPLDGVLLGIEATVIPVSSSGLEMLVSESGAKVKMGPSGAVKSEFRDRSGIFTITDKHCRWRYERNGLCEPLRRP
jgi:hypothetical protein